MNYCTPHLPFEWRTKRPIAAVRQTHLICSHLHHLHFISQTKASEIIYLATWIKQPRKGKISVLVPTLLCIHLLFSRNNTGNDRWPLGAARLSFLGSECFVHVVLDENVDFALKLRNPNFSSLSLSLSFFVWVKSMFFSHEVLKRNVEGMISTLRFSSFFLPSI